MRVESHLRVDRDLLLAVASYGITLLRLFIAAFGAVTILRGDDIRFGVTSIALVMAFDYFDGATFDKSNFSVLKAWRIKRRVADSVSDRLVIQIICIPLLIKYSSFLWLYLPILAREIAISGYISKEFAKGILVYPRSISKVACAMVGIAVMSFVIFPFSFTFITTAVMFTLSGFALLDYIRRVQNYKASRSPMAQSIGSLEEIF
jgi:phosphatidylglycerophosphate synthase